MEGSVAAGVGTDFPQNEASFVSEATIRAISGCASGVFLCLLTIKFLSCFNFGKNERWECSLRECRALWFEGSKGAAARLAGELVCGWT